MTIFPKLAAAAALGVALFSFGPANAQGWYNNGYDNGWGGPRSDYYGAGGNYPSWGVQNGPRTDVLGWNSAGYGYNGYGANAGVMAVCPPGYRLGPDGRLCWPN